MTRERLGSLAAGIGIGALADGIVLHQVLQWHHLWSARTADGTLDGLEENTLADGILHLASLAVLVAGILLVAGRRIGLRELVGLALVGWGAFNVVDQLVFHLALGAHHIRMDVDDPEVYDWAFFAFGVALAAAGLLLAGVQRGTRGR